MVKKHKNEGHTLPMSNSTHIFYSFHVIWIKYSIGNVYKNLLLDVRFMKMGAVKGILHLAA
jgi:hypothetical protein